MYMSLFSAFFRFHVSINRLYIIKLFETLYHLVDGFTLLGSHILHIVRDIGKLTALFDNLGKGASGAAVQNMNIMLGFEETAGLL